MTSSHSQGDTGAIDAIVVMGDHAYNMGGTDDRRGDAYMNAFGRTLAKCPWIPVVGNHEAFDGDHFNRYGHAITGCSTGLATPSSRVVTDCTGCCRLRSSR